ncbi:MAG: ABC transporter permease [Chloroflexi bacterium]|nr:ABC transporter permease [Chloroflexota bacterium]
MRTAARAQPLAFPRRLALEWFGRGSLLRRVTARKVNIVALAVVLTVIATAILAPLIAVHDPIKTRPFEIHQGPSAKYWLGTDDIGRDTFSRLVYGARISVQVGFIAVGIAMGLGTPLGLLAGFQGGFTDEVIMRVMDGIFVLPTLILALAIAAIMGASLESVMVAIGFTNMPRYARLMRGEVLAVREYDYVLAARGIGAPSLRIALVHILPNSMAPIIVQGALSVGFAIFTEATLSFLGVGIKPPTPSWGSMLQGGYRYMDINLIESFAPGMAIFLTVLAVNLLGDGLREALDPRLRGA